MCAGSRLHRFFELAQHLVAAFHCVIERLLGTLLARQCPLAFLFNDGADLWHATEVGPEAARKIVPLDWKMPYVAQWRVDFTRRGGLTDSWDLLLPEKQGNGFIKPSWLAADDRAAGPDKQAEGNSKQSRAREPH